MPRLLSLIFILFLLGCSESKDPISFPIKTKSHILIVISTDDSLLIDLRSYARFPLYSNNKSFKVSGDTNLYISLTANNPDHAEISLENKKFRVFVYPGDTSTIELCKNGDSITWNSPPDSKYSLLINYYFNKDKALEYQNQWQILSSYMDPQYSVVAFSNKADILYQGEMVFFDSCNDQTLFPLWFSNYERNNILYLNALSKLSKIYRHFKYYNDSTAYKTGNLDFLDSILINNEDAILSSNYFQFLINYTIHIGHKELLKVENMDHAFKIIEIFKDSLSMRLDKDISDKYFIRSTSEVISSLPSAYVRFNLDTNILYPLMDTILISASDRSLEPDYIDYLNQYYDKLKESARNIALLTKGDKAPGFYLKGEDGDFHSLKDYRGKIVMLNFWAEYCLPCLNTVPQKNEIVELFSGDDFVLINIFLTSKEDVWIKLIQEKGMKGTNLICQGKWAKILMEEYNVHAIPAYALIDENGIIIQNRIKGLEEVKKIILMNIKTQNLIRHE